MCIISLSWDRSRDPLWPLKVERSEEMNSRTNTSDKPGNKAYLTSRAETNCSGLSALRISGIFVSRSYRALLMFVSISEGLCLEGLLGAILFSAGEDILYAGFDTVRNKCFSDENIVAFTNYRVCQANTAKTYCVACRYGARKTMRLLQEEKYRDLKHKCSMFSSSLSLQYSLCTEFMTSNILIEQSLVITYIS